MWLIINYLPHRLGVGQGEKGNKKLRDSPTMLLKTKENRNDNLTNATISMKTNYLFCDTHDVYENKYTWLKPQVESMDGRVRPRRLRFCSLDRFNRNAETPDVGRMHVPLSPSPQMALYFRGYL